METSKVAIVGFGTIGTGVAKLLLGTADGRDHFALEKSSDRIARHAGRRLCLARIVDIDVDRPREIKLPEGILSDDLGRITDDPEIVAVVQLIGGVETARSVMLKLLESGKDIVTANKALLAEHGMELFDRARALGRTIAFEASVAGGVPIISTIGQCLVANQIQSLHGILNGTSNFILSQMEQRGTSYSEAVSEAQRFGFAEADPTMDVDGSDTAQKLAILAQLAFGARIHWKEIPCSGIDGLDVADMQCAAELGYRIKLLAVAQLTSEGLELHVSPTLLKKDTPLAEVHGAYNAIHVVGDAVGDVFFHGQGAGQMPTASAVVADLIDTVAGRTKITFERLDLWSKRNERVAARDSDNVNGRYYLRLSVEDRPSVLADVTGILGKHNISIASLIQHEVAEEVVPLVIMTHSAPEGETRKALEEIGRLGAVRPGSVRMKVHD